MNAKKILMLWIASFVVTFLLSFLWHKVLMVNFYEVNTEALARQEINMLFVVLGQLILTFLMAYIYPIGYKGGSQVKEGFKFGALIGLIWILPWSVQMHGIWIVPLNAVLVDSAWHIVEEGIGGIAIGLVYGKGTSKASD